jgi:U3 small nucleolar RNA-associated protein 14
MRSLLLQREAKHKRQAKIKSRKYRRLVKAQKERDAKRRHDAGVDDDGDDVSDDEVDVESKAADAEYKREAERARMRMTQQHAKVCVVCVHVIC